MSSPAIKSETLGWQQLREAMPVTRRWAYFDHAAVSALPRPTSNAIATWLRESTEEGDVCWPRWDAAVQACRHTAARLIHADPAEVALVPNTTAGITLVAEGYPWSHGDNVVLLENEFPSNQYPWLNLASRGVEIRRVPVAEGRITLDALRDALDARTRILTLSWVGYATGFRVDVTQVAQLAHECGALCFLDAIQGLGVFPLDLARVPVDFLAADGHKWLLGPEGAGILYVRRAHLDRLRALGVGWNSVVSGHEFHRIALELKPSAARFEGGTLNTPGFIGLGESLALLERCGLSCQSDSLARRVLELGDLAVAELARLGARVMSPRGPDCSSGIISFLPPSGAAHAWRHYLRGQGVVLSARNGWLRLALHAYNDHADLDRLFAAVRSYR